MCGSLGDVIFELVCQFVISFFVAQVRDDVTGCNIADLADRLYCGSGCSAQ